MQVHTYFLLMIANGLIDSSRVVDELEKIEIFVWGWLKSNKRKMESYIWCRGSATIDVGVTADSQWTNIIWVFEIVDSTAKGQRTREMVLGVEELFVVWIWNQKKSKRKKGRVRAWVISAQQVDKESKMVHYSFFRNNFHLRRCMRIRNPLQREDDVSHARVQFHWSLANNGKRTELLGILSALGNIWQIYWHPRLDGSDLHI